MGEGPLYSAGVLKLVVAVHKADAPHPILQIAAAFAHGPQSKQQSTGGAQRCRERRRSEGREVEGGVDVTNCWRCARATIPRCVYCVGLRYT